MQTIDQVTAVIINYKTQDLIRISCSSFLQNYPQVRLLLIYNGYQDEYTEVIRRFTTLYPYLNCLINPRYRYRGPAMDQAKHYCRSPFILFMDSDCEHLRPGFLDALMAYINKPGVYAVGKLKCKYCDGLSCSCWMGDEVKYFDPFAMLLDRAKYQSLPKFIHYSSLAIRNLRAAKRNSFELVDIPAGTFIYHTHRGICSRFGYGLGLSTWLAALIFDTTSSNRDKLRAIVRSLRLIR